MCQRGTKLIAFLKTLQGFNQEWQKSPALGPGKNLDWFGEIERKFVKLSMPTFTYRVFPLNYFMVPMLGKPLSIFQDFPAPLAPKNYSSSIGRRRRERRPMRWKDDVMSCL